MQAIRQDPYSLLELPDQAISIVLQQLDPHSLASTAVTCSKLRHAATANTSSISVTCGEADAFSKAPDQLASLQLWLAQHSTNLTSVTRCSLAFDCSQGPDIPDFTFLPCSALRQLDLKGLCVQLAPAQDCPSVLHDCSSLTALHLQECTVHSAGSTCRGGCCLKLGCR
jgi:hypothetical protein